jgi:hypothetical protein
MKVALKPLSLSLTLSPVHFANVSSTCGIVLGKEGKFELKVIETLDA